MKKINLEDQTEARGYRAILISQQNQYLKGFAFNKNVSLDGIFVAPFSLSNTIGRDAGTLTVPAFNPANLINAPSGATHFRLIQAVACVSDFAYNATTKTYEPIDADNNELANVAYSAYLDLSTAIATSTVVNETLPGSPFFPGTSEMVVAVPAKDRDKFHVATFCFAGLAGSATDEWRLCGMRKTLCLKRAGLQKV